jgi:agmatine deiminase
MASSKVQLRSLPTTQVQKSTSAAQVGQPLPLGLKTASRQGASLVVRVQAAATLERTKVETPASLGYTMPGEFEKHAGCWMGWPDSPYLWRENAKPAQKEYTNIAKAISEFEPVTMFANPESASDARAAFKDAANVSVVELPICDGWTRDWGPTCIARDVDGKREVAGVHWDFDCYGGTIKKKLGQPTQVPDWSKDAVAGRTILEMAGMQVFEAPIHLEGGSIHSDGEGTLVCTEECLLHPSRNPHLGREGIEQVLKDYLGLKQIIWLWKGIAGDDAITNGHVDNFCCFARPGTVLLAWTDDENDTQWERSNRAYDVLKDTRDAKGRRLEIIKVPCPPPLFRTYKEAEGVHPDHIKLGYCPRVPEERLPATYINHYVANGGVVMPSFGGPGLSRASDLDGQAFEVLQKAYPDRKVVAVKSRDVLLNAGNIHCITQQQPASW